MKISSEILIIDNTGLKSTEDFKKYLNLIDISKNNDSLIVIFNPFLGLEDYEELNLINITDKIGKYDNNSVYIVNNTYAKLF